MKTQTMVFFFIIANKIKLNHLSIFQSFNLLSVEGEKHGFRKGENNFDNLITR